MVRNLLWYIEQCHDTVTNVLVNHSSMIHYNFCHVFDELSSQFSKQSSVHSLGHGGEALVVKKHDVCISRFQPYNRLFLQVFVRRSARFVKTQKDDSTILT